MMQLLARGKQRNKVTVAVARELTGFVWHIFQLMAPRMTPNRRRHRLRRGLGSGELPQKPPLRAPPDQPP